MLDAVKCKPIQLRLRLVESPRTVMNLGQKPARRDPIRIVGRELFEKNRRLGQPTSGGKLGRLPQSIVMLLTNGRVAGGNFVQINVSQFHEVTDRLLVVI